MFSRASDEDKLSGEEIKAQKDDKGIYRVNSRIWIPNVVELKHEILQEAHNSRFSIHPGSTKMYQDLKESYWWPNMKKEIAEWISKCYTCQRVKAKHQRPSGLLQPLDIPEWKWEHIATDFVVGLPKTKSNHDAIWIVIDRLTKSAHFLPINERFSLEKLVKLYLDEIVMRHGVPVSIVSDRDPRFNSRFWRQIHDHLGTKLKMNFKGNWDDHLPLIEFSYNNSYHASIGMPPYKALYGRKCRSPTYWDEVGEHKLIGPELVQQTKEKVEIIRKRLIVTQDRQIKYANRERKDVQFEPGDKVLLKISPGKGLTRFGNKGKLSPRYVGPFEVLRRFGRVAYELALPPQMQNLHNVFHVSLLKKYNVDASHVIELELVEIQPDLSYVEQPVRILDRKERTLRNKVVPLVRVFWRNPIVEESTWVLEIEMQKSWKPPNGGTTVKPLPPVMNSGEPVIRSVRAFRLGKGKLSKKMTRLWRTARKSVPGGPYRVEGLPVVRAGKALSTLFNENMQAGADIARKYARAEAGLAMCKQLERIEAAHMFVSEEAEVEVRKKSVKIFVPGKLPTPKALKE
ncbi:hypothetical protein AgCh_012593 [Apium graveolens]